MDNILVILLFASIPLTSALVGWLTNIIAIKMTFYPINFVGFRPIGWQGIIPSKAQKMAEKSVEMLTSKLLNIDERFALIDPGKVAEDMQHTLGNLSQEIIEDIMEGQIPLVWHNTPATLKDQVYNNFTAELPQIVEEIMVDVKNNIHYLLDLKELGVTALTENKKLLNQMFLRCGHKEFKFIEKSGLYFGLPLGLVQMCIAFFYTPWWLLPIFGLLVGYTTNWLALKLIFEPLHPRRFLFGLLTFQGLFIKRQKEVAVEYSKLVSQKILTTESMFEFLVRGPSSEKLASIIKKRIGEAIDKNFGTSNALIGIVVGRRQVMAIKNVAYYRLMQDLPIVIRDTFEYAEQALDMENMLREKMSSLSPREFVNFLRPVFKEDEWILITVGAVLGMLAGFGQYFILFS